MNEMKRRKKRMIWINEFGTYKKDNYKKRK